jgi:hypothetical protein
MSSQVLLYTGAVITALWGIAHLFPTASVVKEFGDISADNKHIITMEWITEGVALVFIGFIVAGVTFIDPNNTISEFIYIASAVVLVVLAFVSIFTGFKVNFFPYKLCPFLFFLSAALIIIGY